MHVAGDAPMPRRVPDALSPDIQRDPEDQHRGRDTCHRTVRIHIAALLDPGVGVE